MFCPGVARILGWYLCVQDVMLALIVNIFEVLKYTDLSNSLHLVIFILWKSQSVYLWIKKYKLPLLDSSMCMLWFWVCILSPALFPHTCILHGYKNDRFVWMSPQQLQHLKLLYQKLLEKSNFVKISWKFHDFNLFLKFTISLTLSWCKTVDMLIPFGIDT